MNENVIEWLSGDDTLTLTLSNLKHKNKIYKLAKSHPEDVEIVAENNDGSILVHMPLSWLKFIPPRELTDEQKEKRKEWGKYLYETYVKK